MSDDVEDRVNHAQEQNRHANVQSDVSIGMEGDGDSGALSKSRDMLREHNELASDASEQMLQQDDAMIDDEIRSGNEGVAEDVLNNGLEQADKQNQLPSEPEGSQPESAPEQPVPEQSQSEPTGEEAQPDNGGAGSSQQEAPSSAEAAPQEPSDSASVAANYTEPTGGYSENDNSAYVGQKHFDIQPAAQTAEPVAPAAPSLPEPDVSGRSDYLMRQADRIEQHANISDITANKGDRNMMRQGVLHQMDKRTLVHDTGMVSRLQGRAKTNMLTHNNKLAADIRDSARTQSKLTAIYSKTHQNAGEAYRRANKLRQAAQQLKLQHTPNPSNPRVEPKKLEPKKLEPKKDNPQMETPNDDFGPHIPQKLGVPKTFNKPNAPVKPKPNPNKGKDDDKEDKGPVPMSMMPFVWNSKTLGPMLIVPSPSAEYIGKGDITAAGLNDPNKATCLPSPSPSTLPMPFIWNSKPFGPVLAYPLSQEAYAKGVIKAEKDRLKAEKAKSEKTNEAKTKDKVAKPKHDNSTAKKRLDALNDRLDDSRRASHQASNDTAYC